MPGICSFASFSFSKEIPCSRIGKPAAIRIRFPLKAGKRKLGTKGLFPFLYRLIY